MALNGAFMWQIAKNSVPSLVSALVVGGISAMSTATGDGTQGASKEKNVLQILEDYDSELVHVFLQVSCLRDDDKETFTHMHRALVRLLTMEMYMSQLPEREDWPRTAFRYASAVQRHCSTLSQHTEKYANAAALNDHLKYIAQLAHDLSFNVKMNCTRAYVYNDR